MMVKCLFSLCYISALPLLLLTMTSSSIGSNMFSAYRTLLFLSSDHILLRESRWYPFLATAQILLLSFMAYHRAKFSVPFCFYPTHNHSQIIDRHSVSHSEFADDSQLYDSVPREQFDSLLSNMQSCVDNVKLWMTQNKLQLNERKLRHCSLILKTHQIFHSQSNSVKMTLFFKISPESRCDFC